MTFLIILVLIVAGVVAYKNRVTLIAKLTGQPHVADRAATQRSASSSRTRAAYSTSSRALRASNAAEARRARSSTRWANRSRGRLSTKYDATPEITNAITRTHIRGTSSATASQMPGDDRERTGEQHQPQQRVDGKLLHEMRVDADHQPPTLEAC